MTPDELARELRVSAKTLRAFLRRTYPRIRLKRYVHWRLTDTQVAGARERFGSTLTPDELARELGLSGKTVRSFLRRTYPRAGLQQYRHWKLTDEQVAMVRGKFATPWQRAKSREDMVTMTVAIASAHHRQLTELAKDRRTSMAALIRLGVTEWLQRHARVGGRRRK